MKFFSDLHLHSKYSRAVSEKMNVTELAAAGKVKGLNLLGTGDFQHPLYYKELKENLKDFENGLFRHNGVYFVLSTEISTMFTQDKKGRKVHNVLLIPGFEIADQLIEGFKRWGRIDYDGRPIFGKTCVELAELCFSISKDIMIIPAHAWTPWFGIFGSMSGFDHLKDCFKEYTKDIYAIETGMSSDPAMNWRLSELDGIALVSYSDAHSPYPWRLGREAAVFDLKGPNYYEMIEAIRKKDKDKFLFTVETNPSYGKYHYDGHRNCGVSFDPKESKKLGGICPVCRKPLTIGVLNRVEQLADRPEGFVPKNAVPFKAMIPLSELIAGLFKTDVATKQVWKEFDKLMTVFGNEFNILLEASHEKLVNVTHEKIADAIMKNREGKIKVKPGYDGVYGVPIFDDDESLSKEEKRINQRSLSDY